MRRRTVAIAAVLAAVLCSNFWAGLLTPNEAKAQDETRPVIEMTLGDPEAPLTVVEYASFTCPHCASFHVNTFEKFKQNYIDTGKVFFIHREVYFDIFGLYAALIARCGNAEHYFEVVDQVFKQQASWTRASGDAAILENLVTIGVMSGLTREQIDACIADEDFARALVDTYRVNAERDGVRSTPSFLIGDELVSGDMPYDDFSALLDSILN